MISQKLFSSTNKILVSLYQLCYTKISNTKEDFYGAKYLFR